MENAYAHLVKSDINVRLMDEKLDDLCFTFVLSLVKQKSILHVRKYTPTIG